MIVFFGIFVCYCAEMFSSTHGGEFCGGGEGEGEEEVEAEAESHLQLSEGRARWRRAQYSNRYTIFLSQGYSRKRGLSIFFSLGEIPTWSSLVGTVEVENEVIGGVSRGRHRSYHHQQNRPPSLQPRPPDYFRHQSQHLAAPWPQIRYVNLLYLRPIFDISEIFP